MGAINTYQLVRLLHGQVIHETLGSEGLKVKGLCCFWVRGSGFKVGLMEAYRVEGLGLAGSGLRESLGFCWQLPSLPGQSRQTHLYGELKAVDDQFGTLA